jgi:hypothetical protein
VFSVIGILLILALLFLFFFTQSRHFRHITGNLIDEVFVVTFGRAAADIYCSFLQEAVADRAWCAKLYARNPGDPPSSPSWNPSPLDLHLGKSLNGLTIGSEDFKKSSEFDALRHFLEQKFPGVEHLQISGMFAMVDETRLRASGKLNIGVSFQYHRKTYTLVFPREIRLTQTMAPVLAKFTLYLRQVSDPEHFNVTANSFQAGSPGQTPLVLYHSPTSFSPSVPDTWKTSGWFYCGRDITLNLDGTSPHHPQSEVFLFWPSMLLNNKDQELPYMYVKGFGGDKFGVRFTPTGAMSDWVKSTRLKSIIGDSVAQKLEKSSSLRLFGDKQLMTPTKVIGPVYSRFILYSTLILDQNADSIPDEVATTKIGKHKAIFPLSRMGIETFNPMKASVLESIKDASDPNLADTLTEKIKKVQPRLLTNKLFTFDGDGYFLGFPFFGDMISAFSVYRLVMSKTPADFGDSTGFRTYNALYDQMLDNYIATGKKKFPAPRQFSAGSYPDTGQDFRLNMPFDGGPEIVREDLTSYDPRAPYLDPRFYGYTPAEANHFWPGFVTDETGRRLVKKPCTVFFSGDQAIPALKCTAPVTIVVEGNVSLQAVNKLATGESDNNLGPVTIVSLNGSITLNAPRHLNRVYLIAPLGEVIWNSPLKLRGGMCVKSLPRETAGGSITYDPAFDPTTPGNLTRGYALMIGPETEYSFSRQGLW